MTSRELIEKAREVAEYARGESAGTRLYSVADVFSLIEGLADALERELTTSLRCERVIHEQIKILEGLMLVSYGEGKNG